MSLPHAAPGDLIDIRPLGNALHTEKTRAFFKTAHMEVMRVVLTAGEEYKEHRAPGEVTFQCLEGAVRFNTHGKSRLMRAGHLLYLTSNELHWIEALEDSSLLLTMQIVHGAVHAQD